MKNTNRFELSKSNLNRVVQQDYETYLLKFVSQHCEIYLELGFSSFGQVDSHSIRLGATLVSIQKRVRNLNISLQNYDHTKVNSELKLGPLRALWMQYSRNQGAQWTYADSYLLVDWDDDFVDTSPDVLVLDVTLYHAEALQDVDNIVDAPTLHP